MKKTILLSLLLYSINSYSNCDIPQNLFTSNITSSNAQANWSSVNGAYKYTVKYRICGTQNWNTLQTFYPDSTRNLPTLQQATCYEWTVRAFCDPTNNQISSGWSDTLSFTTSVFSAAPFNPILISYIDTNYCDLQTSLSLNLSQAPNEPDIAVSTITSDGGYFDMNSLNEGDSVGYAVLTTSNQIINTLLQADIVYANYALIEAKDANNITVGFFTLENTITGIKISSTSPADFNNYTSGFISEVNFSSFFITPSYAGTLNFYVNIESELNDQISDTSSFIIFCNSTEILDMQKKTSIIGVYDIHGRKHKMSSNQILIYHFSDGTIEKKLIIKK